MKSENKIEFSQKRRCAIALMCGAVVFGGSLVKNSAEAKGYAAKVDISKCHGCMHCIGMCPAGAIERAGNKIKITASKCLGCGACARMCRHVAINMISK